MNCYPMALGADHEDPMNLDEAKLTLRRTGRDGHFSVGFW
jgi:hypothetical protein